MKRMWYVTTSLIVFILISASMSAQLWASSSIKWTGTGQNPAMVSNVSQGVPLSKSGEAGDMLQFKVNDHIVGFQSKKMYLAALNHVLTVEFLGTMGTTPTSTDKASTTASPDRAPAMGTVVYRDLWSGISLEYEATKDGIVESTYHVAPGADVSQIRLRYNIPTEAQGDGTLRFQFGSGYLTESSPVAWQTIMGNRVPVKVAFRVSENEVGFSVGEYDSNYQITIDPTYAWHTFYGSSTVFDQGNSIAVDGNGNIYVTGESNSTWGTPLHAHSGGSDIFIMKLSNNGTYLWHTFYGSTSDDKGYGIAVDSEGNVYVTGESNARWGTPLHSGGSDIVVLKLDSNGAYQWHAFYGSEVDDKGSSITLDNTGNVYITGVSGAAWGTPLNAHSGGNEIFILKLDIAGIYQWHTFYGSSNSDYGWGITSDNGGYVYVTGVSYASWGSPLHTHGGSTDIVVLKLTGSGVYQWHTFYGTVKPDIYSDYGIGIAVDNGGNVYIAGHSYVTWGMPLHEHSGGNYADICILKLNSSGVYEWHTFYGSANSDYARGIAVDEGGSVYVIGDSYLSWGTPLNAHSGSFIDFVIMKIDSSGTYQWHTFYMGGSGIVHSGLAIDNNSNIFFTGNSGATWGMPLHAYSGANDIVVLKLSNSVGFCNGADLNGDGNVDGSDLALLIANTSLIDLATFALNFGRNACQ